MVGWGGWAFLLLNAFVKLIRGATHCSDPGIPDSGQPRAQGMTCVFFVFALVSVPKTESSSVSDCFGVRFERGVQSPMMLNVIETHADKSHQYDCSCA